jgi:hypothetical protein
MLFEQCKVIRMAFTGIRATLLAPARAAMYFCTCVFGARSIYKASAQTNSYSTPLEYCIVCDVWKSALSCSVRYNNISCCTCSHDCQTNSTDTMDRIIPNHTIQNHIHKPMREAAMYRSRRAGIKLHTGLLLPLQSSNGLIDDLGDLCGELL